MSKVTVEQLANSLQQRFADKVACFIACDELTVDIAPSDLVVICYCLRDEPDFRFEQLMDVCGVDYLTHGESEWATGSATREGFSRGVVGAGLRAGPLENRGGSEVRAATAGHPYVNLRHASNPRFAVVYHLLSITYNVRVRLRVFLHGEPPRIPTITEVWKSADWYEREAFDLFGILFEGHPDLRRILTDYGFIGHPFRKDFPLIGQVEMRYDATEGRVIYEPVSITPRTLVPKVIRSVGAGLCAGPDQSEKHTSPEKTNG